MAVKTAEKSAEKSAVKAKSTKLQPLGDRIVVEREATEAQTAGGIYLPQSAKNKPSRGTVISIGDGKILRDGSRSKLQVKPGDRVIFTTYGPDEIKIGEEEYLLMREEDVLAVIE